MDNGNDEDRKMTREEKEQAKAAEDFQNEAEFSLLDVVAGRAAEAAASKNDGKEYNIADAGGDSGAYDNRVAQVLQQLQEEQDCYEHFRRDHYNITEKTVPTNVVHGSGVDDSQAVSIPGAYAAAPGQGLVRQYSVSVSLGSATLSLDDSFSRCEDDIECPAPRSSLAEEGTQGEHEQTQTEVRPARESIPCLPVPDQRLVSQGESKTCGTSTQDYLATAHLVNEEVVAEEAQPLTHTDLMMTFLHSSNMGTCLATVALLFGLGVVVTLILAMFVWYEAAFLLATALAVMILLAVAILQASTLRTQHLRIPLVVLLLTTATLVCFGVYWTSKHHQEQIFDSQFYDLTTRLVDVFHDNARLRLQVMDMLSVSVTSFVLSTNQTWPFVVIPDFDAK